MTLLLFNHDYHYEMENICRLFFPFAKIRILRDETQDGDENTIVTALERGPEETRLLARVDLAGRTGEATETLKNDADDYEAECERRMAALLYRLLCARTGLNPPWGILTGVRPGKLMRRLCAAYGEEGARRYFTDRLLVSGEKTGLCMETAAREEAIILQSPPRAFSLYVSVPFCPSRCSYCSFVSHSVERSFHLIKDYVNLLCEEIARTGEIAAALDLKLQTVYIGGGTPTVLSPEQLTQVMDAIRSSFDTAHAREYTVEAGRPDTVTKEKLDAIRRGGAGRVSVNPQTMDDAVLEAIGRRHTAQQTRDAYALARTCGFDSINMDLIAGLPGDTPERFSRTLDAVLALRPENITVHTLSLKRSSRLTGEGELPDAAAAGSAGAMLTETAARLPGAGYRPYYLYRQSKTVGNLENTGYAVPGYEGLYNIYIMDETHTILGCGASAVTKLKADNGHIERIFNFKYPYEYISRFTEMINRKEKVTAFYETYRDEFTGAGL